MKNHKSVIIANNTNNNYNYIPNNINWKIIDVPNIFIRKYCM